MTLKDVIVDNTALVDGQTANGADVTIPLGDLELALENALNALRDYEAVLFERLASDPAAPAAGVAKLFLKNEVGGTIPRLFMRSSSGIYLNAGFRPPSCLVYHNTTQLTSTTGWYTLIFNTETYDTDGFHSTVSQTDRLTIPRTGLYEIWGQAFISGTTGVRGITITTNGAQQTQILTTASSPYGTGLQYRFGPYPFAAADYVQLQVYQETGAGLTISAIPLFGATYVGDYQ